MSVKPKAKTPAHIGSYDVLEQVGTGATGVVYKGIHRITGQVVAIKVVNEEVTEDEVLLKRFAREFSTIHLLNHPNIVHGYEFQRDAEPPYLVMEFVDGESVADILERRGALPEEEAISLIVQVADALQDAHEHGIIHRDVKPDNILVTADGQAKLSDLGLAKDLSCELSLTNLGRGLGTPHFMAPEQVGDAKHVDARCDVYGLGATLYMMVTGVMPFQTRKPLMTMFKLKAWNQYTPPRELVPGLGARVAAVIQRAMQAEIEQRFASAAEFVAALTGRDLLRGQAVRQTEPRVIVSEAAPGKPAGSERRAAVRYGSKLHGACRALGAAKYSRWIARARDISANGICLVTNRRFHPQTVLVLELTGKEDGPTQFLLARVVRVECQAPRRWLIGCRLMSQLSEEALQQLREPS
ncbi:MAG TPA: serine/threonine-protein kinase [Gemmataceae bacterium]|jgi:serine/threonine protein kinase|nr:serine/threonine-protein kinase [Gemmataceae bacterium]